MQHPRTATRLLAMATIVVAAAAVAVGCGDDDTSSSDSAKSTKAAATSTNERSDMSADKADAKDIVDTAVEAGSFSTLVAAVQAAGLEDTLRGDGPFTIFAPTDAAFEKLPAGTVDDLLKPENKQKLVDILTYHAVPAAAMAGDLTDGQKLETVQGGTLTVSIDGDSVKIGDAMVAQPDVSASNGVIHVIDTVLMPPA